MLWSLSHPLFLSLSLSLFLSVEITTHYKAECCSIWSCDIFHFGIQRKLMNAIMFGLAMPGIRCRNQCKSLKSSVCAFADRWQNATFCTHFNQSTESHTCHFNNTIRLDFSIWGWHWCAEGWLKCAIRFDLNEHSNGKYFTSKYHTVWIPYTLAHIALKIHLNVCTQTQRTRESKRAEKYLHDKGTQSTQAACGILWLPTRKYWIFKWMIRTAKAYIEK